jgi:hypothetical protein
MVLRPIIVVAAAALLPAATSVGFGQTSPVAPLIQGVWVGTSAEATGANPSNNPKRLPNILIYTKGYYSIITQDGTSPVPPRTILAPPRDPNRLTDAEKLARYEHWAPLGTVSAGRYFLKGTTLYQYVLVGKNESAESEANNKSDMAIPGPTHEVQFEGNNTMIQIQKSSDGKSEALLIFRRLE